MSLKNNKFQHKFIQVNILTERDMMFDTFKERGSGDQHLVYGSCDKCDKKLPSSEKYRHPRFTHSNGVTNSTRNKNQDISCMFGCPTKIPIPSCGDFHVTKKHLSKVPTNCIHSQNCQRNEHFALNSHKKSTDSGKAKYLCKIPDNKTLNNSQSSKKNNILVNMHPKIGLNVRSSVKKLTITPKSYLQPKRKYNGKDIRRNKHFENKDKTYDNYVSYLKSLNEDGNMEQNNLLFDTHSLEDHNKKILFYKKCTSSDKHHNQKSRHPRAKHSKSQEAVGSTTPLSKTKSERSHRATILKTKKSRIRKHVAFKKGNRYINTCICNSFKDKRQFEPKSKECIELYRNPDSMHPYSDDESFSSKTCILCPSMNIRRDEGTIVIDGVKKQKSKAEYYVPMNLEAMDSNETKKWPNYNLKSKNNNTSGAVPLKEPVEPDRNHFGKKTRAFSDSLFNHTNKDGKLEHRINLKNIPFILGQSTSPSHNLGANVQKILYMVKMNPSTKCFARVGCSEGALANRNTDECSYHPLRTTLSFWDTTASRRPSHSLSRPRRFYDMSEGFNPANIAEAWATSAGDATFKGKRLTRNQPQLFHQDLNLLSNASYKSGKLKNDVRISQTEELRRGHHSYNIINNDHNKLKIEDKYSYRSSSEEQTRKGHLFPTKRRFQNKLRQTPKLSRKDHGSVKESQLLNFVEENNAGKFRPRLGSLHNESPPSCFKYERIKSDSPPVIKDRKGGQRSIADGLFVDEDKKISMLSSLHEDVQSLKRKVKVLTEKGKSNNNIASSGCKGSHAIAFPRLLKRFIRNVHNFRKMLEN